jgi:putative transposase
MPRIARIVIPGCPHHVTQRGNHRQRVFFAESDHDLYFELLRKYFCQFQVDMAGYALMYNHTHKILIPALANSLAKGVGRLHNDFARWQQIQRNMTGHFWQSRFYSCPLDEDHFWEALRYIELNPVRAGLVRHAWDWPWSSARAHVTGVDDTGMLNMDLWRTRFDGDKWRSFLEEGLQSTLDLDRIREATRTGRPLGSDDFVRRLENLTGRSFRPKKRGPKPGSSRQGRGLVSRLWRLSPK